MAFDTRSEEWRPSETVGGCGDHSDADLESIFSNWSYLAAVAWRGYEDLGCGVVVVTVASELADVSYVGGPQAEQYTRYVERYDPTRQLVIVVRHRSGEHAYLLSGVPAPPECASTGAIRSTTGSMYIAGNSLMQ